MGMTRELAWAIVCEFVESDALRRHSLAVETCVVAYARAGGADVDSRRAGFG